MQRKPSVEVKWITAPNDGVGPALLLTIRNGKRHTTPNQYLVNAPEGFARLVLEHRCRPGAGLRALFLTDLSQAAQGGLGGLLLRLRQDGHAMLRLVGPAGLHDTVEGLSYFVRCTHPALELTALTSAQQSCVYDDECLEVRPIWRSSLLWQVPPWLGAAIKTPLGWDKRADGESMLAQRFWNPRGAAEAPQLPKPASGDGSGDGGNDGEEAAAGAGGRGGGEGSTPLRKLTVKQGVERQLRLEQAAVEEEQAPPRRHGGGAATAIAVTITATIATAATTTATAATITIADTIATAGITTAGITADITADTTTADILKLPFPSSSLATTDDGRAVEAVERMQQGRMSNGRMGGKAGGGPVDTMAEDERDQESGKTTEGEDDKGEGLAPLAAFRNSFRQASAAAAAAAAALLTRHQQGAEMATAATAAAAKPSKGRMASASGHGQTQAADSERAAAAAAAAASNKKSESALESAPWDSGSCSTMSTATSSDGAPEEAADRRKESKNGCSSDRPARSRRRVSERAAEAPEEDTGLDDFNGTRRSPKNFPGLGNGPHGLTCTAVGPNLAIVPTDRDSSSNSSSSDSSSDSSSSSDGSSRDGISNGGNNSDTSSREGDSEAVGKGVAEPRSKRRRKGGYAAATAVTAVGTECGGGGGGRPEGCSSADLFSDLDRLFMASAAAKHPGFAVNGRGGGVLLAASAAGCSRRAAASVKGGGGGGSMAKGPESTLTASLALRSQVLQRLRSAADFMEHKPEQNRPQPLLQGRRAAVHAAAAVAPVINAASKPEQKPPRQQLQSLQPRLVGGHAARKAGEQPLGYLLYLKPTRQALLVVAAGDMATVKSLAVHPVTKLLQRAPPGLLLAVAHLAATELTSQRRYRQLLERQLPGPHVWPQPAGGATQAAPPLLAGLGHLGSTRVTMRLNAVAPAIFPLPYELRVRQRATVRRPAADAPAVEMEDRGALLADAVYQQLADTIAASAEPVAALALPEAAEKASARFGDTSVPGSQLPDERTQLQPEQKPLQLVATPDGPMGRRPGDRRRVSARNARSKSRVASLLDTLTCTLEPQSGGGSGGGEGGRAYTVSDTDTNDSDSSSSSSTEEEQQPQGQKQAVAVVRWWDESGSGDCCGVGGVGDNGGFVSSADGGGPSVEASAPGAGLGSALALEEAGLVPGLLRLPTVSEVQREMLQERRSTGLLQMLQALRRACPHLTRSAASERFLQPRPRGAQQQGSQVSNPRECALGPVGCEVYNVGSRKGPVAISQSTNPPPPQQQHLPAQVLQSTPLPGAANSGGCRWAGPTGEELTAAEELAAAAAAYGTPERRGCVMRPSYSCPPYPTFEHSLLTAPASSSEPSSWWWQYSNGTAASHAPLSNGETYHSQTQHGPYDTGSSWRSHPVMPYVSLATHPCPHMSSSQVVNGPYHPQPGPPPGGPVYQFTSLAPAGNGVSSLYSGGPYCKAPPGVASLWPPPGRPSGWQRGPGHTGAVVTAGTACPYGVASSSVHHGGTPAPFAPVPPPSNGAITVAAASANNRLVAWRLRSFLAAAMASTTDNGIGGDARRARAVADTQAVGVVEAFAAVANGGGTVGKCHSGRGDAGRGSDGRKLKRCGPDACGGGTDNNFAMARGVRRRLMSASAIPAGTAGHVAHGQPAVAKAAAPVLAVAVENVSQGAVAATVVLTAVEGAAARAVAVAEVTANGAAATATAIPGAERSGRVLGTNDGVRPLSPSPPQQQEQQGQQQQQQQQGQQPQEQHTTQQVQPATNRAMAMQLRAAIRDCAGSGANLSSSIAVGEAPRGAAIIGAGLDDDDDDDAAAAVDVARGSGASAADNAAVGQAGPAANPYKQTNGTLDLAAEAAAATTAATAAAAGPSPFPPSLEIYLAELNGAAAVLARVPIQGACMARTTTITTTTTAAVATAGAGAGAVLFRQLTQPGLVQPPAPAAADDAPPPACLLHALEKPPLPSLATLATDFAAGPAAPAAAVTTSLDANVGVKAAPVGDVTVLFLGTGSAEPSKYRGASAVLLRGLGPTHGSLLIDAGEGAYGAMVRWLGHRGAMEEVLSLELVWISHKHPDHCLGLPGLLEARGRAQPHRNTKQQQQQPQQPSQPLLVVGPSEVGQWLARVGPLHPSWSFTFLHCSQFSGSLRPSQPPSLQPPQPSGQHSQPHAPPPQQQQSKQGTLNGPLPPAPWQSCPCCRPYGTLGSSGNSRSTPQNLWGGGDGEGSFHEEPLPPVRAQAGLAAAASSGFGSGAQRRGEEGRRRNQPSATARLRWHQQQRQQQQHSGLLSTAPVTVVQQQQQQHPQTSPPPSFQQRQLASVSAAGCRDAAQCAGALGLIRWQSVAVHHCRDAWGLVLEHADGWKLVYSGDTRPCPALISAGREATLLIHEATFEPCLESQARSKRHSTSAEAAAVAEAMGAYRTVLTHFSQRYPRIPAGMDPTARPLQRRPLPAFDGMLLPLAALRELPHILPPLALALAEPQDSTAVATAKMVT